MTSSTVSQTGRQPVRTARGGRHRFLALTAGLVVALVIVSVISIGSGQLHISPAEVLSIMARGIGIDIGVEPAHPNAEAALWNVRLPRVAMSLLVGAALAVAGLLMQAVFGNPLADPGVVGVSSGAALGACSAIVFGLTFFGPWTTALLAFAGGLAATLLVYAFSRSQGKTEVVTLILTGVAINAFAGAGLAFLTFMGDSSAREQIVFWQLGSLNGTRWIYAAVVAPCVAFGLIVAFMVSRKLDLLSLGEKNARHLGVNVERLRLTVIVVVALLVGAAVAFCGIISFVGLVVPHLMRMIIGPGHRRLMVASVLGGAVLLAAADLVARTAVAYADLPLGMLTSLVGGPFFFWLLRRTRRQAGGWA